MNGRHINNMSTPSKKLITEEEEEILRDSLKRCSPETVEAALSYRKTGDSDGEHRPA